MRARYTWHLRPPAKGEFDHSHWWKGKPGAAGPGAAGPVEALYELARRHPLVGELRAWVDRQVRKVAPQGERFFPFEGLEKFDTPEGQAKWKPEEMSEELRGALRYIAQKVKESDGKEGGGQSQLICLASIGEASWAKLRPEDITYWRESVGKLKGVEGREEFRRCRSITAVVGRSIEIRREYSEMTRKTAAWVRQRRASREEDDEDPTLWPWHKHWSGRVDSKDRAEWEEEIAREAVEAHRQGDVLLAIAPDLALEEAKMSLEREYRKHLQRTSAVQERAMWEEWLQTIAAFENDEAKPGGAKSQVFVLYRRMMDRLQFPSRGEPSVTTKH